MSPRVYLAAPFFNVEQLTLVKNLEKVIIESGWRMYSPRRGENAVQMNCLLKQKADRKYVLDEQIKRGVVTAAAYDELSRFDPPTELRHKVFCDNVSNIDYADLLLAVTDDFDAGAMFEVGYAFARHVPIVTNTGKAYGCNLMLAHSVIAHTRTLEAVRDILRIGNPALGLDRKFSDYGAAIAEIQQKYKSDLVLKEGPGERES